MKEWCCVGVARRGSSHSRLALLFACLSLPRDMSVREREREEQACWHFDSNGEGRCPRGNECWSVSQSHGGDAGLREQTKLIGGWLQVPTSTVVAENAEHGREARRARGRARASA